MKRNIARIAFSLLLLGTIANAAYFALTITNNQPSKLEGISRTIPKASLGIKNSKQQDIDASKQGQHLTEGNYKMTSQLHSRIELPTQGKLLLASYKGIDANYVIAADKKISLDTANVESGWQTQTISEDPLWAPGACSAKPTLVLQGRYIFIDDGKTRPSDTYNSYLVYDMTTSTYNYFGGDNFTDSQAKTEKILKATNENDQLVFYIDAVDKTGPLAKSTAFKHAKLTENGSIIRRVIDPKTMRFTDYVLNFKVPNDMPYYYVDVSNFTSQKDSLVTLTGDNLTSSYEGKVSNNSIIFSPHLADSTIAQTPIGPFDSVLEKELDKPLSEVLADYAQAEPYDKNVYSTHFSVNLIAARDTLSFLIISQRFGDARYSSPVIYDKSKNILQPLTKKAIIDLENTVTLGVF